MNRVRWILSVIFIMLLMTPGYGLVVRSGDAVEVAKDEVIDDDLIAFGQNVEIKGKVNGDVCAFAREVTVTGDVLGTIFCGAATIVIDARTASTIWAAGGSIKIAGNINKNVILAGGSLVVSENASIGKDLRAYGGKFTVDGDIDGTIKAGVGKFVMAGKSGDINIDAEEIRIRSGAKVFGDLVMRSEVDPVVEEGAQITGETRLEEIKEEHKEFAFALAPIIGFFVMFIKIILIITTILVGIVIIALFKPFVRRLMDTLISKPWLCLGWGFLGLIAIPVVIMILFAILIGFPFAVFGIYIYTILFYLSSLFVALVVGEKIVQLFKKDGEISQYLSFIVGIVLLFILGWIPIFGFIIKIFVLLFGVGTLLLGGWNLLKEMRTKGLI